MKKLLATTAIATLALTGAASAQSVLERVLQQTQQLNTVTGIFANTADNIGVGNPTLQYVAGNGDILSETQFNTVLQNAVDTQIAAITFDDDPAVPGENWVYDGVGYTSLEAARNAAVAAATADTRAAYSTQLIGGAGSIDGSITNVARRIDTATANVENQVTAISAVTANFGNMSSTVLGAVNTGEIGLGTNQVVEEALAGTSQAVRSTIQQVGTITGSTQLALNSALNTMNINGSISNTFEGVNANVAAIAPDVLEIVASTNGAITLAGVDQLLGSMDTTVLGAVNTGTIVSGVNNQVDGVVASITGNSATNMFSGPTAPAE